MKRTVLTDLPDNVKVFLEMPEGIYKNIIFNRDIKGRSFEQSDIGEEDGKIFYSYSTVAIKPSAKTFYIRRMTKDGFTINEKGKMTVWYGKQISLMQNLIGFLKHYNHNWLSPNLINYVTKSVFEKIMAGKITNNLDVVKAYIKIMRLKVSPALLLKYLLRSNDPKNHILKVLGLAVNPDHALEYLTDGKQWHDMHDLMDQAMILGRKINFKWSHARLKEVHTAWTNEIMATELDHIDDEKADWLDPLHQFTPKGFELLDSKKKVFAEGFSMHHCVYTNYWGSIRDKKYIAYHININGEEGTVGYNVIDGELSYSQCTSKYNGVISEKTRVMTIKFADELNANAKDILKTIMPMIGSQSMNIQQVYDV